MVRIQQGCWEEAMTALDEACALARAMPYPHAEALILRELGQLSRRKGKAADARERLEEALAVFQRLGARKDVERTEQELAALDRSADPTE
jgi:hypothetical protein